MPVRYVRVHERVEVVMEKNGWKLVNANGEAAVIGGEYADFRGDKNILCGGEPPHKQSSTGRVYVKEQGSVSEMGYFPSVIGLRWVEAPQGA